MRASRPGLRLWAVLIMALALVSSAGAARVVAVGDLHGNLDRFRVTLREAALIDAQDHWIGGNAALVQTGDILDRGEKTRGLLSLLMSLEKEAARAGGKVVFLLGNHEVMNIVGDLRYVSAAEWASYAGVKSETRRQAAYKDYVKWMKRRHPSTAATAQAEWMEKHPAGFIEQREAFGPKGQYGRWLRQHVAVAQIDDSIFLHGSLNPSTAALPVQQINDRVQAELRLFDSAREHLLSSGAILPFFTAKEIADVAQEELASASKELAALEAAPPGSSGGREDDLRQAVRLLEQFVASPSWLITRRDGPLWSRGFADWTDADGEGPVKRMLANLHASRFVTGHMPQNRIRSRWNGKVFLIDTSTPNLAMPGGRASALEIEEKQITAIYQGERIALTPVKSPLALAKAVREVPGGGVQEQAAPATTRVWLDPKGNPLPFQTDDELLDFLRTAKMSAERAIPTGVTAPHKLTLQKNGIQANAVFREYDEEKAIKTFTTGQSELGYRDSYLFEAAAYELSRLLGLDVPPAVVRKVAGRQGSLQIWVEKAMTEEKRQKTKANPPDPQRWARQMNIMIVWDALVYNTDRNSGNILITPDWKVWMIDHTRAFRRFPTLQDEKKIRQCERTLYARLKALNEDVTRERLKAYLRPEEITALLKRRDLIVARLDRLIAERGEGAVLFTMAP